jgi:hypothetical protein
MARPERDAVVIVANMVEAAVAGGLADDPRRQDHRGPSGAAGSSLCAPVEPCAGARAHRVDRTPIRAGAGGGAARVECRANLGNRHADLGVSGRTASARSGFKELVGRVCVGEVGAILGLEVSRLARSSADLQRLLELCALTDTLIIDSDGVYDLGCFNDRLLLG